MVHMRACVRACVRVCVRACVRPYLTKLRATDGAGEHVERCSDNCRVVLDVDVAAPVHHVDTPVVGIVEAQPLAVVVVRGRHIRSPYVERQSHEHHREDEQVEVDFEQPAQEEEIRQHTAAKVTCRTVGSNHMVPRHAQNI